MVSVVLACGNSQKKEPEASYESACKKMIEFGVLPTLEKCMDEQEEVKSVFGAKYQEGLLCITSANSKEAVAACMMANMDSKKLEKGLDEYKAKSMSSEAKVELRSMYDGVRVFYLSEQVDPLNPTTVQPKTLPASVGPTPARGACCESDGQCQPNGGLWEHATWQSLGFAMTSPHRYSYEYKRSDDGKSFTVLAHGDLDCDGIYSTYSLKGAVNAEGEVGEHEEVDPIRPLE